MNDNYIHAESTVIYVAENIPGPPEMSVEYDNLLSNFNSQLSDHCKCELICNIDTCDCLIKSGGNNYISQINNEIYGSQLNFHKQMADHLSNPFFECNTLCKCSVNCDNRLVQKGPIKCLQVSTCTNSGKGLGLFTDQFIPKGAFICEYAGEVITKQQARMRQYNNLEYGKMNYIFCLNEFCNNMLTQMIVDPTYFGNIGRYINHSCEANCCIIPVRVDCPLPKLAIFSQVDIPPHSEITFDYGSNIFHEHDDFENRKKCLCGCINCRGLLPNEKY